MLRTTLVTSSILVLVGLVGCNEPPDAEFDLVTQRELEMRAQALDQRLDAIDAKMAENAEAGGGAAAPDNGRSDEAFQVYQGIQKAMAENDMAKAKEGLTKLRTYTDVPPAVRAAQQLGMQIDIMQQQADMIGKDAPPLEAEQWLVGNSSLSEGKATLLVFWEVWCPHCRREVPKLQATFDQYKGQGLNVVGVTAVDNGKTVEEVMEFVGEQNISYPIAKIPTGMKDAYLVQGVPSAAVVKDGKVLWLGHPAQVDESMIKDWLGS